MLQPTAESPQGLKPLKIRSFPARLKVVPSPKDQLPDSFRLKFQYSTLELEMQTEAGYEDWAAILVVAWIYNVLQACRGKNSAP